MKIFSKRSYQFDHPKDSNVSVTVQSQDFAEVPDWVEESDLFKLAKADEDVMIISSRQDEIDAELSSPNTSKREQARAAKAAAKAEADAAAAAAALAQASAGGENTPPADPGAKPPANPEAGNPPAAQ